MCEEGSEGVECTQLNFVEDIYTVQPNTSTLHVHVHACIYLLQSNNVVFIMKHVDVNKVDDVTAERKEERRGEGEVLSS